MLSSLVESLSPPSDRLIESSVRPTPFGPALAHFSARSLGQNRETHPVYFSRATPDWFWRAPQRGVSGDDRAVLPRAGRDPDRPWRGHLISQPVERERRGEADDSPGTSSDASSSTWFGPTAALDSW